MKKKIAITAAVFDCLHEGHINLLKFMREQAETTRVFLHDDKSTFKNKGRFTVQELRHRGKNLLDSGLVDRLVWVFDQSPGRDIKEWFQSQDVPAQEIVYIRGDDWSDFPGRDVVESLGIEIRFIGYTEGVSTTQIRKDLKPL